MHEINIHKHIGFLMFCGLSSPSSRTLASDRPLTALGVEHMFYSVAWLRLTPSRYSTSYTASVSLAHDMAILHFPPESARRIRDLACGL